MTQNMRITKVYTKTGDKGSTGLVDGSRVSKADLRIETYGTVDELNAILGICRTESERYCKSELPEHSLQKHQKIQGLLECLQNDLFNLGADLATPVGSRWNAMKLVKPEDTAALEKAIDFCQENCPQLKDFVLPGGSCLNAHLHLARTVCRRAERLAVKLSQETEINPCAIPFLNRLSDFLFVASRWIILPETPEIIWTKTKGISEGIKLLP
jgi:cob(I)alamin adenosyltransferase